MKIQKIYSLNTSKLKSAVRDMSGSKNAENSNRQINDISNICYKPLSFGRTLAEHKSWGAQINPETKEASFKILTYPDTKRVTVTVEKRNDRKQKKEYELQNMGEGIFATKDSIKKGEVEHGDIYYYTIYKGNGDIDKVKDPYSYRQETLLGESTIYDHSLYKWNDSDWYNKDKNRISKRANSQNGLKPVAAARIFEFNTATLTKNGDFESAKKVLNSLPKIGFNTIEIMPVEATYSYNWGYDGVDKLAPSEHLGGPDSLKSLVDYAHSIGLNVIMDIVPNHLGPDGASLKATGPYTDGSNDFGEKFNYEGKDSKYVRDYIVNSALNWISNYHCDGLRLDMTKYMQSDSTMKQIAAEVNYHCPDAFLIAEDGRGGVGVDSHGNAYSDDNIIHDMRVLNPLSSQEAPVGKSEAEHCYAIDSISNNQTNLSRLGYDSEWDFNFFHTMKMALYDLVNLDEIEKVSTESADRVKYIMSHDEIGNFDGSRLISKLMVPMLHLNENMVFNSDDDKRVNDLVRQKGKSYKDAHDMVTYQKAQLASEQLAIMLQTGKLNKYDKKNIHAQSWVESIDNSFNREVLQPLGIKPDSGITYDRLKSVFNTSFSKYKMALARMYATPGPKMIFQGDERADLTPFRFFRQFESVKYEDYLYTEKGYQPGRPALEESKIGSIKYSNEGKSLMNHCKELTHDLNKINDENPALINGRIITENTVKHPYSQVMATHARHDESGNEIYAITNFLNADYPRSDASDYYMKFPKGKWVEVLNTDDEKYGGSGYYKNLNEINSDGNSSVPVKIAGKSTLIFKRVG